MPTSPKIPREAILEAALNILIRDGYEKVNIKTIAKELNCSTQPISWHFGNMDSLRKELGTYAYDYADRFTSPKNLESENALDAFTQVGMSLTTLAFDAPNLYRFLFMDGSGGYCMGGVKSLTELSENEEMIELISMQNNLSLDFTANYLENMIVYTVGLLCLCISGVIIGSKEEIQCKIRNASQFLLKMDNFK